MILSILGFIVVLVVAAIAGGVGKQIGKAAFAPEQPTPQQAQGAVAEGLEKAARQINDRGPIMIDKSTRMDGASVGPGARLTYHYTFPDYTSQEIDAGWLKATLQPTVRSNVCTSKDMAPSLKYGVTYIFSYSSKEGKKITSFEVSQRDCGL